MYSIYFKVKLVSSSAKIPASQQGFLLRKTLNLDVNIELLHNHTQGDNLGINN